MLVLHLEKSEWKWMFFGVIIGFLGRQLVGIITSMAKATVSKWGYQEISPFALNLECRSSWINLG
jgi:hypothetical protein